MNRKTVVTIVSVAMILTTLIAPIFVIKPAIAADPASWYKTVRGVLDSDYYTLYPYSAKSLDVGFSKFGELVDPTTGTGLNYSKARDPFANEGIVEKKYWLQGWFAEIRYTHRTFGDRRVWAFAMFADMNNYGNDWVNRATDPYLSTPYGGRKCSAVAWTDAYQILYDGPRRFVAMCRTHINDTQGAASWKLLDVIFTIIFEKVKKEVIVLKDIKLTIDNKILDSPVDVQFSNRGEWDLGPKPSWASFPHFYHQEFPTCHGDDWSLAKTILREYKYGPVVVASGRTVQLTQPNYPTWGFPIASQSARVYVNGVFQREGAQKNYTINENTGLITFNYDLDYDTVIVYYKLHKLVELPETGYAPMPLPHLYDVVQLISADPTATPGVYAPKYVAWQAFWPIVSDYTVDGWDRALTPLLVVNEADSQPFSTEPDIAFIIGEWDFMLDYESATLDWGEQFRGVCVYGVTDYHDADDEHLYGSLAIDKEVQYQLDEVFNPWDLYEAVHKDTERWVQFYTVTAEDVAAAIGGTPLDIYLDNRPVIGDITTPWYRGAWDEYGSFAERVIWPAYSSTGLKKPIRAGGVHYELYVDSPTGWGYISIPAARVPAVDTLIKILYSTDTTFTYNETTYPVLMMDAREEKPSGGGSYVIIDNWDTSTTWTDPLGVTYTPTIEIDASLTEITAIKGNFTFSFSDWFNLAYYDIKVFKEDTAWLYAYDIDLPTQTSTADGNVSEITISEIDFDLSITPPTHTDVHIDQLDFWLNITLSATFNTTTGNYTFFLMVSMDPYFYDDILYTEHIPGRYEWTTVGRDAASVDSVGAALVTAAFKNKQIEIGNAGMDMALSEAGQISVPYIMREFGTIPGARRDYKWQADPTTPGKGTALKDDWCTTWPVASSNIIGVGGPLANLFSLYMNDFTSAFYGINIDWPAYMETYTPYVPWQSKIDALTCWSKNAYGSTADVGYATIGTHMDLNGTIGLVIWGIWGRDTFYATQWFHESGIYYLQTVNRCVTSIILEIDYTDPKHPTFSVIEHLSPISEKLPIHPDP